MFKTGQKVVCRTPDEDGDLIKNEIYTIESFTFCGKGVNLKEVKPSTHHLAFWVNRFRAIDTEWVEEVLRKITESELIYV